MIIWDIIERKPKVTAITNPQTISDLAISPMDPYKLSIGGGDTSVKIWKFANPQNPYDISLYYKGLKNKISSVNIYSIKSGLINIFSFSLLTLFISLFILSIITNSI